MPPTQNTTKLSKHYDFVSDLHFHFGNWLQGTVLKVHPQYQSLNEAVTEIIFVIRTRSYSEGNFKSGFEKIDTLRCFQWGEGKENDINTHIYNGLNFKHCQKNRNWDENMYLGRLTKNDPHVINIFTKCTHFISCFEKHTILECYRSVVNAFATFLVK